MAAQAFAHPTLGCLLAAHFLLLLCPAQAAMHRRRQSPPRRQPRRPCGTAPARVAHRPKLPPPAPKASRRFSDRHCFASLVKHVLPWQPPHWLQHGVNMHEVRGRRRPQSTSASVHPHDHSQVHNHREIVEGLSSHQRALSAAQAQTDARHICRSYTGQHHRRIQTARVLCSMLVGSLALLAERTSALVCPASSYA